MVGGSWVEMEHDTMCCTSEWKSIEGHGDQYQYGYSMICHS